MIFEEIRAIVQPGKWYKLKTSFDWYVKPRTPIKSSKLIYDELIHAGGKYEKQDLDKECGWRHSEVELIYELIDLSVIQKFLPDGHPDKIKEDLEYVKCIYVETTLHKGFTVGKIYKKNDFSTPSLINILNDRNQSRNVSLEALLLRFSKATKEEFLQQQLINKKPEEYVVGRYFKALVDNAQYSKIKVGEYYQITKVEDATFFFTPSPDYSMMQLSKTDNRKYYELMPIGWVPKTVPEYVKVKPGKDGANYNNFKEKSFKHYSCVFPQPVIKVLDQGDFKYGSKYYGLVGEEEVAFDCDACTVSTKEAYEEQFKPIETKTELVEEKCEDCNGEGTVMKANCDGGSHREVYEDCDNCNGEGVKRELQSKKTPIVYNSVADLVEGQYYTDGDVIFKSLKEDYGIGFRISTKTFAYRNNWYLRLKNLKPASSTEIEWLDKCIKQEKYFSFEEACNVATIKPDITSGIKPMSSSIKLTKFPSFGACETLDLRLKEYLLKTRGETNSSGKWEKGLAWNIHNWWPYSSNTSKTLYTLEELEHFLPPKQTSINTTGISLKSKLDKLVTGEVYLLKWKDSYTYYWEYGTNNAIKPDDNTVYSGNFVPPLEQQIKHIAPLGLSEKLEFKRLLELDKKQKLMSTKDLTGRYVRVTDKLEIHEETYGFKVGDYLKFEKIENGFEHWKSEVNLGRYHGVNCSSDGRLELMPEGFKPPYKLYNPFKVIPGVTRLKALSYAPQGGDVKKDDIGIVKSIDEDFIYADFPNHKGYMIRTTINLDSCYKIYLDGKQPTQPEPTMYGKTVLAGRYIVVLKFKSDISTRCAKENYCFQQRVTERWICPSIDLYGSGGNSNDSFKFDLSDSLLGWRYASDREVEEYNKQGKPYDVNSLRPETKNPCNEIEMTSSYQAEEEYRPKVGDWVTITKSKRNWDDGSNGMDQFVGMEMQIEIIRNNRNGIVRFKNMSDRMKEYVWVYDDGHFKPTNTSLRISMTERYGSKKQSFKKMEVIVGKPLIKPIKSTFKPIEFKTIKRIK